MEPCWGVTAAARAAAGRAQRCGHVGLVPRGDGLLPGVGRQTRPKSGPSPVDRARPGSKHHVLTEGAGIPLSLSLTGGNRNDVTQLLPLIDKTHRCAAVVADRAGDQTSCTPTAPTTTTSTAEPCTPNASVRASPAEARHTARASARSGGCGTHDRLVPRHETPTHPLGTPRRS